jgi:hypothetical protein
MGDIINAVADLLGFGPASKQADATQAAAQIGAESANQATQLQREMWQAQQAQQQPWMQAGTNALARMQGGEFGVPGAFQFDQSQVSMDPGYGFRLAEGQKALDRQAAARGGLISGAALKAATRYGQDMGSQEYQNAYSRSYGRAMDEYNSRVQQANTGYNRLASMAGLGQTAGNQLASSGQNYANTAGNIGMIGGANQANALMAGGNIRASQYGTAGRAMDQLYNYGSKNNWFGGGSSPEATNMTQEQYAMISGF